MNGFNERTHEKIIDMTYALSTILCICPMIFGIIMWNALPETMPVHFGVDGEPDGWGGRWMNVFLLPLVMAAANTIVHLSFNIKAIKAGKKIDTKFSYVFKWFCPVICLMISFLVYSYSLGFGLNASKFAIAFVSVLFIIIGNYFPKAEKWMFNIPVKEENLTWLKRVFGWGFVITGILSFVFAFTSFGVWFFLGAVLILLIVTMICARKACSNKVQDCNQEKKEVNSN